MSETVRAGDDIDAYVRERAAPRGSTLYYCTVFSTPEQARRSIALQAFLTELNEIVDGVREPAVVGARVGWWHEELGRLREGRAEHPVTRVLGEALDDPSEAAERLAPAVVATAAACGRENWASEPQLEDYCRATGGEVAALDCREAPADTAPDSPARRLGALLCRQDMLAGLFGHPRRGAQALPASLLSSAGLSIERLFAEPADLEVDRLLREQAQALHSRIGPLLAATTATDPATRVLRTRAAVALATLRAIIGGGHGWLSRHASVSPLHKLWIGWRHRHR